ncbi:MAG: zinc-ribbon domain-containing protein [Anaerolineae bacterium]
MDIPKFCQNCGAPLSQGVKFCESCGNPVAEIPAGPAQAAEPMPSAPAPAAPFTPPQPPPPVQAPVMQGPPGYQPPLSSAAYPEPPRVPPAAGYPPATPPPAQQYAQAPGPYGQVPGGVPPAQPKKSKTGCWIAGGCAVLLLVLLIIAVIAWRAIQSAAESSGIVETISSAVTVAVEAERDAPAAEAQRTPDSSDRAPASLPVGQLLYSDDFADEASGWDTWESDESSVWYEGGRYHLLVNKVDWIAWGNPYEAFDDCVVQVETIQVEGPDDNGFGLLLRYVDVDNFYRFEVSGDGYYRFDLMMDNEWHSLIEWTETTLINTGNATNVIAAVCAGSNYTFYINGTEVDSYNDDTFSSGDVGLTAGTIEEVGVHVAFDNLKVWSVE